MATTFRQNPNLGQNFGANLINTFLQAEQGAARQRLGREQFEFQKQQLRQRQAEAQADAEARRRQEIAQRTANISRMFSMGLKTGRVQPHQALSEMKKQGIDIGQFLGPQGELPSAEDLSLRLQSVATGQLGPAKGLTPITRGGKIAFEQEGLDLGTPQFRKRSQEIEEQLRKEDRARAKAGATVIGDNIGASKNLIKDMEENLFQAQDSQDAFRMIREIATVTLPDGRKVQDFSQFLSAWNRGKQFVADYEDFFSIPVGIVSGLTQEEFQKAKDFRSVVDKFRAEEFKRLLGSAQSKQEIANLINTIISANMTPTQFERALSNLERLAQRKIDISNRVLREGIELDSARYRRRFAQIERQESDNLNREQLKEELNQIASRIKERNPQMSDEEIKATAIDQFKAQRFR